jgi:hypothetical protein
MHSRFNELYIVVYRMKKNPNSRRMNSSNKNYEMDCVAFNPLKRKVQPNNRPLHKNIVPISQETLLVVSTKQACHSCLIH